MRNDYKIWYKYLNQTNLWATTVVTYTVDIIIVIKNIAKISYHTLRRNNKD